MNGGQRRSINPCESNGKTLTLENTHLQRSGFKSPPCLSASDSFVKGQTFRIYTTYIEHVCPEVWIFQCANVLAITSQSFVSSTFSSNRHDNNRFVIIQLKHQTPCPCWSNRAKMIMLLFPPNLFNFQNTGFRPLIYSGCKRRFSNQWHNCITLVFIFEVHIHLFFPFIEPHAMLFNTLQGNTMAAVSTLQLRWQSSVTTVIRADL